MEKENLNLQNIKKLHKQFGNYEDVAKYYNISSRTLFNYRKKLEDELEIEKYTLPSIEKRLKKENIEEVCNDLEMSEKSLSKFVQILKLNQEYAKNEQKYRDISNAKGKRFREYSRIDNCLEELSASIFKTLSETKFDNNSYLKKSKLSSDYVGVIHWSDLHFNEYVDIESNRFDWDIASKRIKKHVSYCIKLFNQFNINKIFIAGTGDFLNSDRRLDELLINCDNRAKAVVLAFDILRQAILELSYYFNVSCVFVCGNESRLDLDINNTKKLVSNNFDYTLSLMLNAYFKNNDNVNVLIPENPEECVVNINGKDVLLLHGHKGINNDIEGSLSKIITKNNKIKKCNIEYSLFGHIHSSYISDNFARSGSLTGDNEYSFNKLQLTTKASQNCYIIGKNDVHGFKIDLQNVDGVVGYKYDKKIESYNSKSKDKCNDYKEIIKIII